MEGIHSVADLRRASRAIIVVLGAAMPAVAAAQAAPAGAARAPLVLHGTCEGQGQAAVMRVQIVNTANRPTALILGFTAPDGQTHVVNSIGVVAIRLATGADEDYVYVNPKYALAEGAPWIVSLAPGATHDLELPLHDFISSLNYTPLDPSVAGGTRLVLEPRPVARQMTPVWTGRIETMLDRCRP